MKRQFIQTASGLACVVLVYLLAVPVIIVPACQAAAGARHHSFPFRPGEKCSYTAQWGIIPAGSATLEVHAVTNIDGVPVRHFSMTTTTNEAVDLFYKIRERQDSYTDMDMTRTVVYTKKSTGKHPRDVVVRFDRNTLEATYFGFGEALAPVRIVKGTFDPLAVFFLIRLYELKVDTVIEIPVSDGKKCILVKAAVVARESLSIGGMHYDTFQVIPDMERLHAVFKKNEGPRLRIWFTADAAKIPVKIESKAGFGRLTFDLISCTY